MKVIFKLIRMKNFLKTGDQWTTIKLNENHFTVIMGKNGTGKSTMIDAICYVLFNKAFRKVNLGQLVNTFNKKNSLVEIMFTVGGSDYVVRRGQKPKVFEIYKDKELIEVDPSTGDYQDHLEKNILHMNYQTFTQINILGKATWKPFMQLDAKDRRAVVEEILDSKVYSVMASLLKDDIKSLKETISGTQTKIMLADNEVTHALNLLNSFKKNQTSSLEVFKESILKTNEEIKEKTVISKQLQEEYDSAVSEDHGIPAKEKLLEAKKKIDTEISILNIERNNADTMIRKIQHIETCPTCLQVMDDGHKDSILKTNQSISAAAVDKTVPLSTNLSKLEKFIHKHELIEDEISSKKRKLDSVLQEIQYLNKALEKEKTNFKEAHEKSKESAPNIDLEGKENEAKRIRAIYDEETSTLATYSEVLKEYLGDDGLKSLIVKNYIPNINTIMNDYLDRMDLFVQFTLDEEFEETIRSHYRDNFSYNSFSEGQKLRIDLAILLTWRNIAMERNSTSSNLLIMDEILDSSLDDDGVVDFLNILKTMGLAQNVFIISHKTSTQDNFENSINVSLDGNFTIYENS